jgi:hypothetical protein
MLNSSDSNEDDDEVSAWLTGQNDEGVAVSEDLDQDNFSTSEDSKIKTPTLYLLDSKNPELFAFSSESQPDVLDESLDKNMELKGELFPWSRVIQGQKHKDIKIQKVQDLSPLCLWDSTHDRENPKRSGFVRYQFK